MSRSKLLAKREEKILKIRQMSISGLTWLLCLAMAFGTLILLVSGMRLLLLSSNQQFVLKDINIQGNTSLISNEEINNVLQKQGVIENKINLFQVSPKQVRKNLESHPAVHEVLVERVMPYSLNIQISEKQASAQFIRDGKMYLLSSDSTLLPAGDMNRNYLPLIAVKSDEALTIGLKIITDENAVVFKFLNYYDSYSVRRNGETFFPSQIFKVARVRQDPQGDLILFLRKSGINDNFKIARDNVLLKLNSGELALSLERACTFLIENRVKNGAPINKYIDARSHRVFVE